MRKLISGWKSKRSKKDKATSSTKDPDIDDSSKSPSTSLSKSRAASSNTANITKDFSGPEIRPNDIDIVKTISSGKQGAVFKAVVFGHEVAVKEITFDKDKKPEVQIENFKAEVKMMSEIHHPNRACLEESKWRLVTELCKCDLDSILADKKRYVELTLFDKIEMAKDIAMGMAWLHELGIVHLDLKPKNILVDKHGVLKVADFGYSRLMTNTHNLLLQQDNLVAGGSPLYMSPERLVNSRNYSKASDVYSFAIIFWEILTSGVPFENHSEINEFKMAVIRKGERPPIDRIGKVCGEAALQNKLLIDLLNSMWEAEPDKRQHFHDAAVSDEVAKSFWKDHFHRAMPSKANKSDVIEELRLNVPWNEFASALYHALKSSFKKGQDFSEQEIVGDTPPKRLLPELPENPSEEQIRNSTSQALDAFSMKGDKASMLVNKEKLRREWVIKVMRLKSLLINSNRHVHITRFGKICDTLGPWDIGEKNKILDTISSLMKQSWFYGYLSKDEAYERLKDKPPATFLIRFGATQNRFVISRVVQGSSEKKVVHNRIKHEYGHGFSLPGGRSWKTLEQLVEGEAQILKYIYKPEHPIATVVTEENWWGNDVAQNASYYYDEDLDLASIQKNAKNEHKNAKDKGKAEPPKTENHKGDSAKTDSNKNDHSAKNEPVKSDKTEAPKQPFNNRVSKDQQSSTSSSNQTTNINTQSATSQNYVGQSNSKEYKNGSQSNQSPSSSSNAYERIPGGGPPPTVSNKVSELLRELEALSAQQSELLMKATSGQGGEALFRTIGELVIKMENLRQQLEIAKKQSN